MADQLNKQRQLQRTIDRALDNFRKLGRANQTPAKIRCRLSLLKDAWNQYHHGHCKLMDIIPAADQSSFDYFKDNHYDRTEETFITTMDHFSEALEGAEPSLSQTISPHAGRDRKNPEFSLSHLPSIHLLAFSMTSGNTFVTDSRP